MSSMGTHALPFKERQAWEAKSREVLTGIQGGATVTVPWIDATERVAWLTWCQRSLGIDTPVSGDALRFTEGYYEQTSAVYTAGQFRGSVA